MHIMKHPASDLCPRFYFIDNKALMHLQNTFFGGRNRETTVAGAQWNGFSWKNNYSD